MQRLQQSFERVGRFAQRALLVGGAAIGGFVKLAADQEQAVRRINAALMVSGNSVDAWSGKLQEAASAIQDVTTFGDEATLELMAFALAQGVAADKIEETAKQAIGLARITGQDVNTAMRSLILATQGEFMMLNRYIPAVRNATSESEKMAIVNEFAARGFKLAKDDAKTFTGQLSQLKNSVGDLGEEIGNHFLPNIAKWASSLKAMLPDISEWVKRNGEVTASIALMTAGMLAMLVVSAKLITVFATLAASKFFLALTGGAALGFGLAKLIDAINGKARTLTSTAQDLVFLLEKIGLISGETERIEASLTRAKERSMQARSRLNDASSEGERIAALDNLKSALLEQATIERRMADERMQSLMEERNELVRQVKVIQDASSVAREMLPDFSDANLNKLQNQIAHINKEIDRLAVDSHNAVATIRHEARALGDEAEGLREDIQSIGTAIGDIDISADNGAINWMEKLRESAANIMREFQRMLEARQRLSDRVSLFGLTGQERDIESLRQNVRDMIKEANELGMEGMIPEIRRRAQMERDRILSSGTDSDAGAGFSPSTPSMENLSNTFRRIQSAAAGPSSAEQRQIRAAEQTEKNTQDMAKSANNSERQQSAIAGFVKMIGGNVQKMVQNLPLGAVYQ